MKKRLPIFTTPEGRADYMAAYEEMFSLWTVPYEALDVKTGYGSTHINVSGPSDGHPLVLLHGAGLSSTVWFPNIAALSTNYRVYAVDIIGDAGKSVADRLMEKRTDYAAWLREVFDGLNIERANLLGHSYGGWLTLNMALSYPDRLRKIVLLAPAASIYPMSLLTQLGLRLPLKIRPPARFVFKMIASKGTVFKETFIHLMEMVTRYCLPALMFPRVYTDEELKQIKLPTLLLIGAGEKIYNPKKAIARVQRLMPDLTAEIIPNVHHTLNMEQPDIINSRVLEFLNSDHEKNNKNKFKFPVGYHDFHKDQTFNFQLNRWYSIGYARFEDMEEAGQKINSFEEWKIEMLRLADIAASEGRLMNAAFYYRAAESFTTRDDPNKELLYNKFIDLFYKAFQDDKIKNFEVPYNDTFLPAIRKQPVNSENKGAVVLHGGFDSFIEELYFLMKYFSDCGYEVIAFDGPGQGGALKRYGLSWDYEWEKPTKAILDYFQLNDVTLLGISMGGWFCIRAAAFELRIKRVIAWSVSFDVIQYTNIVGQQLAKLFFRKFRKFTNNAMVKKMKKNLQYSWFVNNLMYITNKEVPIEGFDVLLQLNEKNLHSDLVKQDVLVLTGRKDHMIPFKMHNKQVKALTNAKSVTARVFTKEEHAQNHCQIGNIGLVLDTMVKWIEEKKKHIKSFPLT